MGWGAKQSKLPEAFVTASVAVLVGNQLQVKYVYKEDAQTPALSVLLPPLER